MAGEIKISLEEHRQQSLVWQQVEEAIEPEIEIPEPWGELEVLNRYVENYGRLSLLLESYVKLLQEDRQRILGAVVALLDVDANLLKQ